MPRRRRTISTPSHPLYRLIAALSALRRGQSGAAYGASSDPPLRDRAGLLAVTRLDPDRRPANTCWRSTAATAAITRATCAIGYDARGIEAAGRAVPRCHRRPRRAAVITLPPFGYAICELTGKAGADRWRALLPTGWQTPQ